MSTVSPRPASGRRRLTAAATAFALTALVALAGEASSQEPDPAPGQQQEPEPARAPAAAADEEQSEERPRMRVANTVTRRTFLDSKRKARFDFELGGRKKRDLIVKAIRIGDGEVKRRWRLDDVPPKQPQRITWNGKTSEGSYTSQGKHTFKVFERGAGKTNMNKATGKKRFRFYKHRFPIAAKHTYGDGFGAGRGHQGIDIFAECGKKVRAARGGKVQVRSSHSAAGKYLVIDGHATGRDYVYMHLRGAGRPSVGERVRTGEAIGRNSDTGNASGCHLHFEIWSSPGWYEGGRAIRPGKRVRRWDSWS